VLLVVKLLVVTLTILILFKSSEKFNFVKNVVLKFWKILLILYIGVVLYLSIRAFIFKSCLPLSIRADYFEYVSVLIACVYAIIIIFQNLDPEKEITNDENANPVFAMGWLLIIASVVFFGILGICWLIITLEHTVYKATFDVWSKNFDGSTVWMQLMKLLEKLTQSSTIYDIFVKYIFTAANIVFLISILATSICLIMNPVKDRDELKSENRLTMIYDLLSGFSSFFFLVVSIVLYITQFGLDDKWVIPASAFGSFILVAISISLVRQQMYSKKMNQ
jgi:hypothetical protein